MGKQAAPRVVTQCGWWATCTDVARLGWTDLDPCEGCPVSTAITPCSSSADAVLSRYGPALGIVPPDANPALLDIEGG
jgi:hypothetical protein